MSLRKRRWQVIKTIHKYDMRFLKGLVLSVGLLISGYGLTALPDNNATSASQVMQLHPFAQLKPEQVNAQILKQMEQRLVLAKTRVANTQQEMVELEKTIASLETSIEKLSDQLKTISLFSKPNQRDIELGKLRLQQQLTYQQALLDLATTRSHLLQETYQFNMAQLEAERFWLAQIKQWYHEQQEQQEYEELWNLLQRLNNEQTYWLRQLNSLNQELASLPKNTTKQSVKQLEQKILEAEDRSYLSHLDLLLAQHSFHLKSILRTMQGKQSIADLNAYRQQLVGLREQLTDTVDSVQNKVKLLEDQLTTSKEMKASRSYQQLLMELMAAYRQTLKQFDEVDQELRKTQAQLQQSLNEALARRQGLPGLELRAWLDFGKNLMALPGLLGQTLKSMAEQLWQTWKKLSIWRWLVLFGIWGIWLLGAKIGNFYLLKWLVKVRERPRSLTENFLFVLGEIIHRNRFAITGCGLLISIIGLSGLSLRLFKLIFSLLFVYFSFRTVSNLARLFLLESVRDRKGKDVSLYFHLRWTLWVGGGLAGLLILAEQLPVTYEVKEFFNRLLMLFLLAIAIILFKAIDLFPLLLTNQTQKKYVGRVLRLASYVAPLVPLSTAIVGLLGYVELAWRIGRYQLELLIVLISYLLLRGMLVELIDWISLQFIRKLPSGWLWREVVLKPLDKLSQLGLLALTIFALFEYHDWNAQTPIIKEIFGVLNFPLFDLAGNMISLITLFQIAIAAVILVWIGRWSREFAYRWLFSRTRDVGIRNSLSVFTQYTVVIISIYIGLKIIGLDLTGLAFIAAGLAVGVGFGLRDLANNYVSGILLLIERPVRKGDIVTINDYEGVITHIGARSMILLTWDNMEVVVPNSEAFSKSFINWTLQDSIVRTVIPIQIQRTDNPYQVQAIILDELRKNGKVLEKPVPQVFIKDMESALLEFEVRYFIDLRGGFPRAEVRSEILFSLWERFKEMGIQAPNIQQDVYIRALPEEGLPLAKS